MEAKSETNKPISNFLFILWAGGTALLSYSLVYALRKPFTAATFDGMDFFGMDYKVATTIMQIFGYLISKFFAIKIVSELKREEPVEIHDIFRGSCRTCIGLFRTAPHSFQCICIVLQRTGAGVYVGSYLQFH